MKDYYVATAARHAQRRAQFRGGESDLSPFAFIQNLETYTRDLTIQGQVNLGANLKRKGEDLEGNSEKKPRLGVA